MEFLRELLFGVVDVVIVAALLYFWNRSRIPAILILAAGLVLLAFPVAIVAFPGDWFIRSEGSPAATIWFIVVVSFGVIAALAGTVLAMVGTMRLLRVVDSLVLRFVGSLGVVAALLFAGLNGYRMSKRPPQPPEPVAARVENFEPHRGGKDGARQALERQRYDECVAYMRESYRRETLKTCADELVAAWDASHAAKTGFANMPADGEFAASIGALYAAYADATHDHGGALAGVRGVGERTRQRYRGSAAIERLERQASELENAANPASR